ncbi:MAG: hypothetical protein IJO64_02640 [Clostridia bacterium]|nr:hypothetical protein [Clostridia bacterium]
MGLFRKKNEPQAPAGIKLIKRFQFERKKEKTGDNYVGSTTRDMKVLDTYAVSGKTYVVETRFHWCHEHDIRDDHGTTYEHIYFTVFPIAEADAQNEARVNAALAQHSDGNTASGEMPDMRIWDDDKKFSEYIMQNIKPAIKNIKASQKIEKLMEGKDNTSNAVHVGYDGSAWDTCVYDFTTQYGLGEALAGSPTRVNIHDGKAVAELCNMSRGLCWYYNPHPKSGAAHNYPMSALLDWSIDGDLMICGKSALGKPEALTAEEIESITAALNSYKRVFE